MPTDPTAEALAAAAQLYSYKKDRVTAAIIIDTVTSLPELLAVVKAARKLPPCTFEHASEFSKKGCRACGKDRAIAALDAAKGWE